MINFGKNVLKTKQLKTREIYIYISFIKCKKRDSNASMVHNYQ